MSTLVMEIGWDEEGTPRKWIVPSASHPGYSVTVAHVPGQSLTCTCPAGVANAKRGPRFPRPSYCRHVRAVVQLVQERVA